MRQIYFTSDLHLGHQQMIPKLHRPFDCIEQMNEQLIANINSTVGRNDTLYILGDFSYRISREQSVKFAQSIECREVHLINGNHDKDYSQLKVFASVRDYCEFKYGPNNRRFCLFHFPITAWAGQRGGSVQLHGHIHSKGSKYNQKNFAKQRWQYDVGVDANDYRPVSIDHILKLISEHEA